MPSFAKWASSALAAILLLAVPAAAQVNVTGEPPGDIPGTIPLSKITPIANGTVVGNGSGSTASPIALTIGGGITLTSTTIGLTFGTAVNDVCEGGKIAAAGPIGSATLAPILTYDACGTLTAVSSATITPAIGSVTGLGSGVATALGDATNGTGGLVTYGGAFGNATGHASLDLALSSLGSGVATALGDAPNTAGGFQTVGNLLPSTYQSATSYGGFACSAQDYTGGAPFSNPTSPTLSHYCSQNNPYQLLSGTHFLSGNLGDAEYYGAGNWTFVSTQAIQVGGVDQTTNWLDNFDLGLYHQVGNPAAGSFMGGITGEGETIDYTGTESSNPFSVAAGTPAVVTYTHTGIQALINGCTGGPQLEAAWSGQTTFGGITLGTSSFPLTATGTNTATFTVPGTTATGGTGGGTPTYSFTCTAKGTYARYWEIGGQAVSPLTSGPLGSIYFATASNAVGGSTPRFGMAIGMYGADTFGGDLGGGFLNLGVSNAGIGGGSGSAASSAGGLGFNGTKVFNGLGQLTVGGATQYGSGNAAFHEGLNTNLSFSTGVTIGGAVALLAYNDAQNALIPVEIRSSTFNLSGNNYTLGFSNSGMTTTAPLSLPGTPNAAGNEILCFDTTNGPVTYENAVSGCVPSDASLKNIERTLNPFVAMVRVAWYLPSYYYKFKPATGLGDDNYIGLLAQDVCAMDAVLCRWDAKGDLNYDKIGLAAYVIAAIKGAICSIGILLVAAFVFLFMHARRNHRRLRARLFLLETST